MNYDFRNENLALESSEKKMKLELNALTSTPGPRATIFPPNFSDVSEISSDQEKEGRWRHEELVVFPKKIIRKDNLELMIFIFSETQISLMLKNSKTVF